MFPSRFVFIMPAVVCLALAACGGSSSVPVQALPPPAQSITGNERLGWDQQASDSTALASIRYALYVDGARAELGAATCATDAPSDSFPCSSPLPALSTGMHRLELAAYVVSEGALLESARASPITVIVAASLVSQTLPVWQPGETIITGDGVRLRV